jgi:hypothetical protein
MLCSISVIRVFILPGVKLRSLWFTALNLLPFDRDRRLRGRPGVNTTGSTVGTANVARMAGLERNVGRRAAQAGRNGHWNVRLRDELDQPSVG